MVPDLHLVLRTILKNIVLIAIYTEEYNKPIVFGLRLRYKLLCCVIDHDLTIKSILILASAIVHSMPGHTFGLFGDPLRIYITRI
jgi:hypothetical protein